VALFVLHHLCFRFVLNSFKPVLSMSQVAEVEDDVVAHAKELPNARVTNAI
jgi:hypothetical protein